MVQALCNDPAVNRPAGQTDVLVGMGRRNVEGGGRQDAFDHTSYRGVLGARGDIGDTWKYDVYGLLWHDCLRANYLNDFHSRA